MNKPNAAFLPLGAEFAEPGVADTHDLALDAGMALALAVVEHFRGTDAPLERQARAYIEARSKA